jgi:hypothetical protein
MRRRLRGPGMRTRDVPLGSGAILSVSESCAPITGMSLILAMDEDASYRLAVLPEKTMNDERDTCSQVFSQLLIGLEPHVDDETVCQLLFDRAN